MTIEHVRSVERHFGIHHCLDMRLEKNPCAMATVEDVPYTDILVCEIAKPLAYYNYMPSYLVPCNTDFITNKLHGCGVFYKIGGLCQLRNTAPCALDWRSTVKRILDKHKIKLFNLTWERMSPKSSILLPNKFRQDEPESRNDDYGSLEG